MGPVVTRRIELVADNVAFGESVRWRDGRVWFCDWIDGHVCSMEADGSGWTVHAHVDGFPVSIDWTPSGELLVVDGRARELLRAASGGQMAVLADLSAVSDRPWNEIVTHPSGLVYVNGVGFDMMAGEPPATGQIAAIELDGTISQVADGLAFPNGMAISADGTTLAVAESHAGQITAFTIAADGSLADRRVFAAVEGSAPDGIAFAADGSLWYADVPNQHCQRVADGGAILETVDVDRGCFSCAIGPSGDLFIAATVWDDRTFSTRRGVIYRATTIGEQNT